MSTDPSLKPNILEEEAKRRRRAYWIGFGIASAISALLALGSFFLIKDGLQLAWEKDKWRILADTFTLPGVMFVMAFLLVKVTDFGAFDAIVYSVRLAITVVFRPNVRQSKLPANYRDYRLARMAKKRTSASFLLFVGLFHLLLAGIFILLYLLHV